MIGSWSPEQCVKVWKVNDWNTVKVRVEGKYSKITTWINGLKVYSFDGATVKTDKYEKQGIFENLGPNGSIAVQVHGGTGWPSDATFRSKNPL